MMDAVGKIGRIDRKYCREYALENFNDKKMTENYLKLYNVILEGKAL